MSEGGGTVRLLLVRHGETDANEAGIVQGRRDNPLSELGRRQVAALGQAFAAAPLTAVYSSPLIRAWQTALQLAEPHGVVVVPEPDLVELDIGEMEGLSGAELRTRYPDFLRAWRTEQAGAVPLPGGESLQQVQDRAGAVLDRIIVDNPNGLVGVVSHNFVLLSLLCRSLTLPLHQFRRLRQRVAGVSIVDVTAAGSAVVCVNDACHLERAGLLGADPWQPQRLRR